MFSHSYVDEILNEEIIRKAFILYLSGLSKDGWVSIKDLNEDLLEIRFINNLFCDFDVRAYFFDSNDIEFEFSIRSNKLHGRFVCYNESFFMKAYYYKGCRIYK